MKDETQIENEGRRKAVKTIVGGVTALAAYNVLPSKWGIPVIEQVFLPAHAATSGAIATFSLTVQNISNRDQCGPSGVFVNITGTVSASDGRNLAGTSITVVYADDTYSWTKVAIVQTGNIYTITGTFEPDDHPDWDGPDYEVTAAFTDQATYGNASVSKSGSCNT
ncbi:MAG: hypothetical protein COA36_00300 [Desulfotalea sp.]|nr:MAG: hypothetical protein COA36_00300 [Desulfotalea sp.]